MGLGKQGRTDGKAYTLKLRLKEGDKFLDCAVFDVQEKVGDKYETTQQVKDVSGDLFSLEARSFDHDKGTIRSFKAGLRDAEKNEAYFVDVGLGSGLGRSLANSILNLKATSKVEIGLYGQKSKKDGKTYPAVSLRQGGVQDTVKWAFDPKDGVLPAVKEITVRGGKKDKDPTDQEIFLLEKLKAFGATLGKGAASLAPEAAPAEKPAKDIAKVKSAADVDPEQVPF